MENDDNNIEILKLKIKILELELELEREKHKPIPNNYYWYNETYTPNKNIVWC